MFPVVHSDREFLVRSKWLTKDRLQRMHSGMKDIIHAHISRGKEYEKFCAIFCRGTGLDVEGWFCLDSEKKK